MKPTKPETIYTMQDIRNRLNRLNAVAPDCNHELLFKDRFQSLMGKFATQIRNEYQLHWNRYGVGKANYSTYEAIEANPIYFQTAKDIISDMERSCGIVQTVYIRKKMTTEQKDEFCVDKIIYLSEEDFQAWFERRLDDFQLMFNSPSKLVGIPYGNPSAQTRYIMAMQPYFKDSQYKYRLYGERFYNCAQEMVRGIDRNIVCTLADLYNCDTVTPRTHAPKDLFRTYMVLVAEDCLVL